ncbi:MAG: hypothetical protein KGH78_03770 [Candidatus Micrarchaeota archaeon]|nr:hypothetical protein [Candidatus Micrarchaeota archaeon]
MLSGYGAALVPNSFANQFNVTKALNDSEASAVLASLRGRGAAVQALQLNMTYGNIRQGSRPAGAGSRLHFFSYNGTGPVSIYNVTVRKAVPNLMVSIGGATVNSSTSVVHLLGSSYVRIGNSLKMLPTYSIGGAVSSSILDNNLLPYSYSLYIGGRLMATTNATLGQIRLPFSYQNIPAGTEVKVVFDTAGNSNYTPVDPTVFYTTANAALTITSNTVLASDLVCGSLTINTGIGLTTNGFSIICNGTVTNNGQILAGGAGNGATGATIDGGSFSSSYAGSGGGAGGGGGNGAPGGAGSNSVPVVDSANIVTWYTGGFLNFISGAGGGSTAESVAGGAGGYGVYIQANKIVAGAIKSNGLNGGTSGTTSAGNGGNGGNTLVVGGAGGAGAGSKRTHGSGGGGGGLIILSYGAGGLTAGTYTTNNGAGGTGTLAGGGGGGGAAYTFNYGTSAPILVLPLLSPLLIANPNPPAISNSIIDIGQYTAINTIISNGISPYTGNWFWTPPNTLTAGSQSNTIIANILSGSLRNSVLTVNAYSSANIVFSFNGIKYFANALGTGLFYGSWSFAGNYFDPAQNVVNPSAVTLTINPALGTPSIQPSSPQSNSVGDSVAFIATASGGSSPYTYNYQLTNTITNALIANQLWTGVASATNTFTYTFVSGDIGQTEHANVIVKDFATIPMSANSIFSGTITISSATCVPVISNSLITFPSTPPGSFAPVANAETITNSGSSSSYIVLYSTSTTTGNWLSGSLSFLVGNTVWDGASHASAIVGNQLTNSITTNSLMFVPSGGSNSIFFGVNVPVGQAAATYAQGITVSLTC